MLARASSLSVLAIVLSACGGRIGSDSPLFDPAPVSSGGGSSSGTTPFSPPEQPAPPVLRDAGVAPDSSTPETACFSKGDGSQKPGSVLPYLKVCASAADCMIALHATHCCGRPRAVGIAIGQSSAFSTCEATWAGADPCDCAGDPSGVQADDGNVVDSIASVAVACEQGASSGGLCRTYVP